MASFVGIDIGNNTCKLALRDGKSMRVIASRMPDNVVDSAHQIISPESLATFLGNLRKEEQIRERDCLLVLAESEVFFRHATLPPMTADEVMLNLPFEFRDYITGDPSSYTYDYLVDELVKDESGSVVAMNLFAAATSKKLTELYGTILRKAGFRLRAVIPPHVAYSRMLASTVAPDSPHGAQDRTAMIVDIGHDTTIAMLFRGTRYQVSKAIGMGCSAFDDAIAELRDIDRHTAGTYKYSNFDGVLDSPECQAICERFCVEIGRVVSFYNYDSPDADIDRVYLMGGGAQISQLDRALRGYLRIPVESVSALLASNTANDELTGVCALAIAGTLESEVM